MVVRVTIMKGTYRDSVSLMKISNTISKLEGVLQAAVVMATPTNKQLLKDASLVSDDIATATPNDLVIAVEAVDEGTMNVAMSKVETLLATRESVEEGETRPKTLDSALRMMPDANLVMISVPGEFARREAMKALRKGLNVFLFSSNVPIQDELQLKKIARERGLLLMGPDCGTAIINNIALGFGNALNRGPVGLVSASGTGLQEVCTIIDREGLGISQAIGTGSNDLSEKVGGIMMVQGIELLEKDTDTKAIVLISKPPDPRTSDKVLTVARQCKKPVVVNFLGGEIALIERHGCVAAATLEDAAMMTCALVRGKRPERMVFSSPKDRIMSIVENESSKLSGTQKYVRGLFSGGTLCHEAMVILRQLVGEVYSNVPINSEHKLPDLQVSKQHTCIDMGSEDFTVGRPHPMIDFTLRKRRIMKESKDPETAVLLLDVVLGYGAHQDPAGELIPPITSAKTLAEQNRRFLSVVAYVVGTRKDPQDLQEQESSLEEAGVIVMPTSAQAARMAALIASRGALEEGVW